MMTTAIDPVTALTHALSCPTDSPEQATALKALRAVFESQPATIPQFCQTLLQNAVSGKDSLFKRFTIELFGFALGTAGLSLDVRTQLASDCLELAATLLASADNVHILKLVIQCFCNIYPLLFRLMCTSRTANRQPWDILSISKHRILDFVDNPTAASTSAAAPGSAAPLGARAAAVKFVQRVILVQTRLVQDPRLQNRADPNLSLCPTDHPFIDSAALETEGRALLTQTMAILYTSSNADIVMAVINTFGQLAKLRPALVHPLIEALVRWEPHALAGESVSRIRSAEKTAYILLGHLLRKDIARPFVSEVTRALDAITERINKLARLEHLKRAEAAAKRAAGEAAEPLEAKRVKLDSDSVTLIPTSAAQALVGFDWRTMGRDVVTDLIVANLQHFSEHAVLGAIAAYHAKKRIIAGMGVPTEPASTAQGPAALDDEEIEYEPDKLNMQLERAASVDVASPDTNGNDNGEDEDEELALQLVSANYELPAPKPLDSQQINAFLRATMLRFVASMTNLQSSDASSTVDNRHLTALARGPPPSEMWIFLLIRMVTRAQRDSSSTRPGAPKPEKLDEDSSMDVSMNLNVKNQDEVWARNDLLRGIVLGYIMADLPSRLRIATLWMNEEWYNDSLRHGDGGENTDYSTWLERILDGYRPHIDPSDRTLSQFLLDLPHLPPKVFALLAELCVNQATTTPGLDALRELVTLKPPVRAKALRIILDLTTHPETVLRIAAIKAVKRWVPDVKPMDHISQRFAVRLLRRLESYELPSINGEALAPETEMQDAELNSNARKAAEPWQDDGAPLSTPYLSTTMELPARPAQILQHVQLIFALCVKVPDLLEEIFLAYSRMEASVQNAVQDHLAPVIRSIGTASGTPAYSKLLSLLRTFRSGAESLALHVIKILSDGGRPSSQLVALVKELIDERDLDARFLIPIIAELDRSEIIRQIPRVVSMLGANVPGSKPGEEKTLVRSVFMAVLEKPESGFGKVSTNLPRLKETQLLEPVRLLVLLHESPEINISSAREAIDICFGLTDFFPSEILAAAIQQLVDNATLPVLFMRTVIQAIKTYKTLIPYVAGGLMTRLIQKKIWTIGKLWDGFVLCGKIIAPASYPSLLLLPANQLAEVAEKHPTLRVGLREYVLKKGGNTSRYLDVLGREEPGTPVQSGTG